MFGKKFLGILIIILILSIGAVSASEVNSTDTLADMITVNESDNFQEIIDNAQENDIIEITNEIEPYNVINIGKNLTLQGTNHKSIVDYASFNIEKGDVTVKDLTFKKGMDRYVIMAKNDKLNLINCTFLADAPIEFGGKTLTLTDCTIKNTQHGVSVLKGDVEVSDCLFENIQVSSLSLYNGNLILINSTFKNADTIDQENGQSLIRNNRFINGGFSLKNTQATVEGNIFNTYYPTIDNPSKYSFKDNTLLNSTLFGENIKEIANCEFISSGINAENCYLIKDCVFRNFNSHEFTLIRFSKNLHLTNCSFINNTCNMMLTPVDCDDYQINGCLFENNTGYYLIYCQYFKKLQIENTKFYANSLSECLIECMESKNFNLVKCEFKNNTAGQNLIKLKEIETVKINSNVISDNICPNTIHISFLDYHMELNEKITTSIEMTNNIIATNYNKKNNPSYVYLSAKIASNAVNMKWGTKLNLKNNFYGLNFVNFAEFKSLIPITFEALPSFKQDFISPANLELYNKDTLRFVDLNGNPLKMPEYSFSIKNKTSNEIIVSNVLTKDGKGTFTNNNNITLTNSFIINEGGKIVNRPKVSITITKKGSSYDDFSLQITLTYNNTPIANQNVAYYRYVYSKSGKLLDTLEDDVKTNQNGKFTFKFFPVNFEEGVDHYAFKVKFLSKDYALTQKTLKNIKIKKIKTTVKAPKVTNKFKKTNYFKVTVKNKRTNKAVKNTNVKVKIGKKTYNIKTNSNGMAKFNTKNLNVGKYNIVISSGNPKYSMSAKSTIKIRR